MNSKILILIISVFISITAYARCCSGGCCVGNKEDAAFYSWMLKHPNVSQDNFADAMANTYPYTTKADRER